MSGPWAARTDGPLEDDATRDALAAALAAEHAAIWSYGLATAFLPRAADADAEAAVRVHRDRRDAVEAFSTAAGVTPVPAAASYRTPGPVTDGASAGSLLAAAEDDVAGAWRALLERTDDPVLRRTGVDAVVAAAGVGVRWRRLAGTTPLVPPFPGAPPT